MPVLSSCEQGIPLIMYHPFSLIT